jgi:hypothetical protein
LKLWTWFDDDYNSPMRFADEINLAIDHLGATGTFFKHLAYTFIFITFVQIANGFLICVLGPG